MKSVRARDAQASSTKEVAEGMDVTSDTAIVVTNLTRRFAAKDKSNASILANDCISFTVRRGEVFGLLGPNGAGKTTLVNQLLGLLRPTSGRIWMEGIDVVQSPDAVKRIVGFLPQSRVAMQFVGVERALYFIGRLRGQSAADARQQAAQLVAELEMAEYARRPMYRLSGGMARMANFAMALMGRPQILILDEPTNELDPKRRRILWDVLAQRNRDGATCILVTHNVMEAEHVIDRVAVMRKGRIVALGTGGELKQRARAQARWEFHLESGYSLDLELTQRLSDVGTLERRAARQYRLLVQPHRVEAAVQVIVNRLGLNHLEDYRFTLPSLEDVYLDLSCERDLESESE